MQRINLFFFVFIIYEQDYRMFLFVVRKPSFFNFKDTKKWNSWSSLKGMSKLQAQGMYIKHIKDIQSRCKSKI